MVTDITGSYYGGRRPLTFGMRPGQFRNTRASIFPSQTIINNNIGFGGCCNFDYGCDCGNSSNKMNWMDWTMMGGIALTGIGNILSCFWGGGGGGSKEVEEKPVDTRSLKADVTSYQKAYKDKCSAANVLSNGKILATINGKPQTFDSLDDFIDALNNADTDTGKPATVTNQQTTPPPTQTQTVTTVKAAEVTATPTDENPTSGISKRADFKELIGATYVNTQGNYDPTKGLKVNNNYYKTPTEAYKALTNSDAAQVTSTNTLNNILGNIKGVWDDSATIGDAPNATATLEQNKTYKSGDTIKIGSHTYKISTTTNGYVYLEAQNTSGNNNTQIYQVETYQDGNTTKYRLYQRENIAHGGADQGYNKAAFWSSSR